MKNELLSNNPATAHTPRGRGFVLIVDDEEQNRTLLRDPLEAHGYEIAEAVDGAQALRSIAERRPDVVLLDVMMPGMDGFEVCRRMKLDAGATPLPVLLVTALSDRKERLMGIAAGANDFLTKPVDVQDVTLRVGNAVHAKHLFDQLQAERERSERLLLDILPGPIAQRMKNGEVNIADQYPDATVLVTDLVGFTALAAHIPAEQVVCLLNEIFSAFDGLVERHGLEKIKTIGDAYMAAGGVCLPRSDHAQAIAKLALAMREEIAQINGQYNTSIQIRTGIHTGALVAGVIGRKKFAFDLWGDTVNVACRLESLCEPGTIQVSEATYDRLKNEFRFDGTLRLECKGRGEVIAHRLCGTA